MISKRVNKKDRNMSKCVSGTPADMTCMDMRTCQWCVPFIQLKCHHRNVLHCNYTLPKCVSAYLYDRDRCSGNRQGCVIRQVTAQHASSCWGLTRTTRPSDPGGPSSGTEGGKWGLLLVCDLCSRVIQTALFPCCHPSLRISEHASRLVNLSEDWASAS